MGARTNWENVRLAARLRLCIRACAPFTFQFCLWGSFTTLDNFITAHLVLFILITQAAKHRLRAQAFPEFHSFASFPHCSSTSFMSFILIKNTLPKAPPFFFFLLWLYCVVSCIIMLTHEMNMNNESVH